MVEVRSITVRQRINEIEKETAYLRYKLLLVRSMQIKLDPLNKYYGDLDAKERMYVALIDSNDMRVRNLNSIHEVEKQKLITYYKNINEDGIN